MAEINAAGSRAMDVVPRADALALLRANAAAAAAEARGFTPEHLRRSGRYIAELPAWTLDEWLERMLIGHVTGRLRSIRAAVAADADA